MESYNCVQTYYNYYQIGIVTLNYKIMYKWFVLDKNAWYGYCVQTNDHRQKKNKF